MIEDDPNQKLQSKRKTYAPIAFGSKTFNPTQTKMSIYAKEFLSIYSAFCRIWTPNVKKHLPGDRVHRQSIGNPIFSNKNDPSSTLERLQLCITIQFCNRPCCWFYEHSSRFFYPEQKYIQRKS